jgi:hypothetical protein
VNRRIRVAVGGRGFERALSDQLDRSEEREIDRAAADDLPCSCGWITARAICPSCDRDRAVQTDPAIAGADAGDTMRGDA